MMNNGKKKQIRDSNKKAGTQSRCGVLALATTVTIAIRHSLSRRSRETKAEREGGRPGGGVVLVVLVVVLVVVVAGCSSLLLHSGKELEFIVLASKRV